MHRYSFRRHYCRSRHSPRGGSCYEWLTDFFPSVMGCSAAACTILNENLCGLFIRLEKYPCRLPGSRTKSHGLCTVWEQVRKFRGIGDHAESAAPRKTGGSRSSGSGDRGGIQTHGPVTAGGFQVRYHQSLGHTAIWSISKPMEGNAMEHPTGIEPATFGLQHRRSAS